MNVVSCFCSSDRKRTFYGIVFSFLELSTSRNTLLQRLVKFIDTNNPIQLSQINIDEYYFIFHLRIWVWCLDLTEITVTIMFECACIITLNCSQCSLGGHHNTKAHYF